MDDELNLAFAIHACHEQLTEVREMILYMQKCGEGTDQREWLASHHSLYRWAEEMTLPGDPTLDDEINGQITCHAEPKK